MQVRAIFESAAELKQSRSQVHPRNHGSGDLRCRELDVTKEIVDAVHADILKAFRTDSIGVQVRYND